MKSCRPLMTFHLFSFLESTQRTIWFPNVIIYYISYFTFTLILLFIPLRISISRFTKSETWSSAFKYFIFSLLKSRRYSGILVHNLKQGFKDRLFVNSYEFQLFYCMIRGIRAVPGFLLIAHANKYCSIGTPTFNLDLCNAEVILLIKY